MDNAIAVSQGRTNLRCSMIVKRISMIEADMASGKSRTVFIMSIDTTVQRE